MRRSSKINQVKDLTEQGLSTIEIARSLNLCSSTVSKYKASLGLAKSTKEHVFLTPSMEYRIKVMSLQGELVKDIAATLDVSEWTVKSVRSRLGIAPKRDRHFRFVSPQGDVVDVENLTQFCKQQGLHESLMSCVWNGKQRHHKGWKKAG